MTTENKFTTDSAKEYIGILMLHIAKMQDHKRTCLDFSNALKNQSAKYNHFISWCFSNYHHVLILNLCAVLESPGTRDNDGKTTNGFIKYISTHITELQEWYNIQTSKKIIIDSKTYIETETEVPVSDNLNNLLSKINFNDDINNIQGKLDKLKPYRDKKICHLTTSELTGQDVPGISELHEMLDELFILLNRYAALFREYYSAKVERLKKGYDDFNLVLH